MNEAEKLLYNYYEEDNYIVLDFEHNKKKKLCYVFFSSNGLYKDRNDVEIIKETHRTDRYEWKYISANKKIRKKASRIIFLRDIFKAFYIKGINSKYNTIDKVVSFLSKATNGMDIVLAGSSAGAYMSLLVGNTLKNTKRVISIGGIVDLNDWKLFSDYLQKNLDKSTYKDISDYLFGDYWIINFYGKRNNYDKHNGDLIERYSNKSKLINVGFDVDVHAPRPSGHDLIKLLVCTDKHLKKIKMKIDKKLNVTETEFSIFNIGILRTFLNKIKSKIIKHLKRNNHEKKA